MRRKIKNVDENLIDFITKCLIYTPSNRMTAEQALKHPYIVEKIWLLKSFGDLAYNYLGIWAFVKVWKHGGNW